jgi:hypothetical protein
VQMQDVHQPASLSRTLGRISAWRISTLSSLT